MIEHLIPAWMLIPFVVMLLCIAVLPLIPHVGEWWEHNLHKLYVSLLLGTPVGIWLCLSGIIKLNICITSILNFSSNSSKFSVIRSFSILFRSFPITLFLNQSSTISENKDCIS